MARCRTSIRPDAEKAGKDVSGAKVVLADIDRLSHNSVHWSQNDAWYLNLRDRMARAIVALRTQTAQ